MLDPSRHHLKTRCTVTSQKWAGPLDSEAARIIYRLRQTKRRAPRTRRSVTVNTIKKEVYHDSRTVESIS